MNTYRLYAYRGKIYVFHGRCDSTRDDFLHIRDSIFVAFISRKYSCFVKKVPIKQENAGGGENN